MAPTTSLRVECADEMPVEEIATILSAAFGRERTPDWVRWKHLDGPWGPSRCWLARDGDDVVGVRLMLPWQLCHRDVARTAWRATDGAVLPSHRRQGLYRQLVEAAVDGVSATTPTLSFTTPVPNAERGLVDLGWRRIGVVGARVGAVLPRRAALELGSLDEPMPRRDAIATAWSRDALAWRTDPRSGHTYGTARLRSSDGPNGIVYRVIDGRVRRLVVIGRWGDASERRALVRAVARDTHSVLVHEAGGRGRSGSAVVVADAGLGADGWPVDDVDDWDLCLADVEGVL